MGHLNTQINGNGNDWAVVKYLSRINNKYKSQYEIDKKMEGDIKYWKKNK